MLEGFACSGERCQLSLVVMGSLDPDFPDPRAEAQWIARQLRGKVLMIPGAGHYPQAEFPEIVSPALVEFARQVGQFVGNVVDLSPSHT